MEPARGRVLVYIPAGVHRDSAFPFRPGEDILVEIADGTLVLRKLPRKA